jgi:hypothetical protein
MCLAETLDHGHEHSAEGGWIAAGSNRTLVGRVG